MRTFATGPTTERFQHEAVFYHGLDDLASMALPLIREGLERQEPVLVAVPPDRIRNLRHELGPDADRLEFLDMAQVGANPRRVMAVWQRLLHESWEAHSACGIAELVWSGRRDSETEECRLHESLLNVAFDDGPTWRLLCHYDADSLPTAVLDDAMRTHPIVTTAGGRRVGYGGHAFARAGFATPLSAAPESAQQVSLMADELGQLRGAVRTWSLAAGLSDGRAADVVVAANELATNSIRHGGGTGVLRAWTEPDSLVVEVSDGGRFADPLVGQELALDASESGRGLWIVNQLCDLVQVRSLDTGTVVRLHSWL